MGRRRIVIEKIENKNKRQVTFSKRRKGLFQKAADMCIKCNSKVAVITFSPAGKSFTFGHSSADSIINRYLNKSDSISDHERENEAKYAILCDKMKTLECDMKKEQERKERLMREKPCNWLDSLDLKGVHDLEKLCFLENRLKKLKENMARRVDELSASSSSQSSSRLPLVVADQLEEDTRFLQPVDNNATAATEAGGVEQWIKGEDWPTEDELAELLIGNDDDFCTFAAHDFD